MSKPAPNISQLTWNLKYQLKNLDGNIIDFTVEETFRRVAKALSLAEKPLEQSMWEQTFYDAMSEFMFLPAGRILSGAGTDRNVTLFNCYVMGKIDDSMPDIFKSVTESALTQQQGGGIGMDFSTLRPKGAVVKKLGSTASGPLSFMDVWDTMCRTILSAGSRRGAMMGHLRCDHPDIEEFIQIKRDPQKFRMFNLSILVTDNFMQAVKDDASWNLIFEGKIYKTVSAKDLWNSIIKTTFDVAEPGVIFIDRINVKNNLNYCETIYGTNPCGEQPLPPYGACLLGSINLAPLVQNPFMSNPHINTTTLEQLVPIAVRMMDNVIDVSKYPLPEQEKEAKTKRRMGLGITGLADALVMCGKRYNSDEGRDLAAHWMRTITDTAYKASALLAKEKGQFQRYDAKKWGNNDLIRNLSVETKELIEKHGLRNSHLTSIAPTGTISLFAGNVSSGIEPIFNPEYERKILEPDGSHRVETVTDYAVVKWHELGNSNFPPHMVTIDDLNTSDHLKMQATLQEHIDSSISKTINCPEDITFENFRNVYEDAYKYGLKGCTTYRPNEVTGSILSKKETKPKELNKIIPRDLKLDGSTYKVKPNGDHALYITINDIEEDGKKRPFEIFFSSKAIEHFQWSAALSRMISAVFRRGNDVAFVVEELKAIFDPRGGYWEGGKYIPSAVAAIGMVIEQHMHDIGFIEKPEMLEPVHEYKVTSSNKKHDQCPKCGQPTLVHVEGCHRCLGCTYTKCG